jgi:hypothetical protein
LVGFLDGEAARGGAADDAGVGAFAVFVEFRGPGDLCDDLVEGVALLVRGKRPAGRRPAGG